MTKHTPTLNSRSQHINTKILLSYLFLSCSLVTPIAHDEMGRRIDPSLSYFIFQSVFHDWCSKDRGMCYPVCEMMHIKEPLLLIGKSSPCGGSGFPLSLSEWSFTICLYHITVNKMCSVRRWSKHFLPSFLPLLLNNNGLNDNVVLINRVRNFL